MRTLPSLCLLLLSLAGCSLLGGDDPDGPASLPAFDMHLEPPLDQGDQVTQSFEATVTAVRPNEEHSTWTEVRLDDLNTSDTVRTLSLRNEPLFGDPAFSAEKLPLEAGQHYRFDLTLRYPVFGSLPILQVEDERGLVLFGLTDTHAEEALQERLPEGWSASLRDAGYRTRTDDCNISKEPRALSVTHPDETVRLEQGEEAAVGDYRVRVQIARRVKAIGASCTDLVVPEVSLTIRRTDAPE